MPDPSAEPLQPPPSPLAYANAAFLESPEARSLRILAEYLEPLYRLRRENVQDTIVFFGSARIKSREVAQAELAQYFSEFERQNRLAAEREGRPGPDARALEHDRQRALELSRYYEEARELARLLTRWADGLATRRRRFVITSGGGPGIMEAANRGAREAGGKTIGLNIQLPFEQHANPYVSESLGFEFHYFFMRKFWFAYPAKALVAFPGGFGTLDELMEILTLAQTQKLAKKILVLLYGSSYWKQVVNFDALVDWGTIAPADLELFRFADTPEEAFQMLKTDLERYFLRPPAAAEEETAPAISRTR